MSREKDKVMNVLMRSGLLPVSFRIQYKNNIINGLCSCLSESKFLNRDSCFPPLSISFYLPFLCEFYVRKK